MVDVIAYIQRIFNTGDLERLMSKLGIKIPVAQYLKQMVNSAVPVFGAQFADFIGTNFNYFIHAPAEEIYNKLNAGSGNFFDTIKEDITFELFGKKFTIKAKQNKSFFEQENVQLALLGLLGIFIFSKVVK